MLRVSLLALLAAASFAQDAGTSANKPPAKVDRVLRQRIEEFYQLHINKEFRKAEALVAPDTKDYFYSHNKPAYLSCELRNIIYSDNFTKAKATVACEQFVMIPGFTDKPLKVPFGSTWKIVKGKWYWYVDQDALRVTPFGRGTPGAGTPAGLPTIPTTPDFVMSLVKADKKEVGIKPGASVTVTIANGAPGPVELSFMSMVPGVEAKFDNTSLKIAESTVLTLTAGENAKSGTITVRVEPTGQMIPIKVNID